MGLFRSLLSHLFCKPKLGFQNQWKKQQMEMSHTRAQRPLNVEDVPLDKLPPKLKICTITQNEIQAFKEHLPTMAVLCNPGIRSRHWKVTKMAAKKKHNFLLSFLLTRRGVKSVWETFRFNVHLIAIENQRTDLNTVFFLNKAGHMVAQVA